MLPVWQCDVYQPHAGLAIDNLRMGHRLHPNWAARQLAWLFNQCNAKRRGLTVVERKMMAQRPWLLCFSEAMKRSACRNLGVPADRLMMLMNGIDLGRFDPAVAAQGREEIRAKWRINGAQRMALFVGNSWERKGVAEAIEAVGQLRDPRLVLLIAGRGKTEWYRRLAAKWGVEERVIFAGLVSDPRPLYGAADLLLLPTRQDTCSLVALEALVMGLPVLTTRQNGASDVITDGKQGAVVESGDIAGMCAALKQMMEEGRLKAMAAEALALRTSLSFAEHVRKVEEVYGKVVAERAGGAIQNSEGRIQNL
jgi:UDP-glucose:(heptosyl)LPS alpha-1,3-glucosyltransferase